MNSYQELAARQQAEVNAFPFFFAFNNRDFEEGMRKLGLDPSETDKIRCLGRTGGYYRINDADAFREMLDRHERERQEAIAADLTGDGFIYEMFDVELADHEYSYTGDASDALCALGITFEKIAQDPRFLHGFEKACNHQMGR